MTAAEDSGAITILIFRNLKQITIEKSLGVGKNTLHRVTFCIYFYYRGIAIICRMSVRHSSSCSVSGMGYINSTIETSECSQILRSIR